MAEPRTLPNLPDDLSLRQVRATLSAFGYELAIVPETPPAVKVGFAADHEEATH